MQNALKLNGWGMVLKLVMIFDGIFHEMKMGEKKNMSFVSWDVNWECGDAKEMLKIIMRWVLWVFVKNEFFMTCATDSKLVQLRTRRPDAEGHSRQGRSQQSAAESV